MKKAYLAAIIFLCILVAFTLSANSNNSKINWIPQNNEASKLSIGTEAEITK